jgi:hypothetical protein
MLLFPLARVVAPSSRSTVLFIYISTWFAMTIYFLGGIAFGRNFRSWNVWVLSSLGGVLGFSCGLFFPGYWGMYVGLVFGPLLGASAYFVREWQEPKRPS